MSPPLRIALIGHSSVDEDFTYAFGLYRIQAYLLSLEGVREAGHRVEILDRKVTSDEAEDLELVLATQADIVGLSAYLWNLPRVVRLVSALRARRPELLIVVGGPSSKGYEDLAVDDSRPDFLVVGPGEQTFANIVERFAAGTLDAHIPELGNLLSYRGVEPGEPPTTHTPTTRPKSLDFLPSPYLMGLVEVDTKTLYVETDRGCPYSCAFCVESTAPNKVAEFSMDRVEAELRWALARDFEHIEMCSAIFNRDTAWMEQFIELVERLDPDKTLSFSAALYSTYINERQAALLARLNLRSALFGLNSVNSETFKSVRRVVRLERFKQRMELLKEVLRPEVSLIMGLPGDTPAGFAKTLDYVATLDVNVMVFRFMVLPATIYYEQRERYQLEIDFANDNRILSTHSYSAEDFAQMEAIAEAAGYVQVNPGQWSKRRDEGFVAPKMDQRTWNFLYLSLREIGLDSLALPASWRFDKVVLELRSHVQLVFLDNDNDSDSPGAERPSGLDVFVSIRDDDSPRFSHSRYFNVAYREHERRSADEDASAKARRSEGYRPLLEQITAALAAAERSVLTRRKRGGAGSAKASP
ncbi:radical SAM domain protein [Plesiocystis pacifica SIR-1]|uniref:Radical SAM domain protein n=1 Tax=Plesiocystis pacifica SIR-1 TaxID=391625 RepID=A6FYD5_9BACT|nr:B12-binding domain-containing radical SAM protein [Plesiocystis pacifica]EDM81514.1 radical SAM domain protein [Plesiocystis pacifica SIR-1]